MARTKQIRRGYGDQPQMLPRRFPSPFLFIPRQPVTLVELRMRTFSGTIRSKPNWWTKVHDPEIVAKWRQEMIEQDRATVDRLWGGEKRFECGSGEKKWPRDPITDAQLDYIFDQLTYEAGRYDEATGIVVSLSSGSPRQSAEDERS